MESTVVNPMPNSRPPLLQKEHVILRAVVAVHMVDNLLTRQTRPLNLVDILRHASAPYYHSLCFLTCVTEEPPR